MFLTVYILVTRGDNLVSIYEAFGDSMTDKVGVAQFVLYATQGLIGDGFMVSSEVCPMSDSPERSRSSTDCG